MKLKKIFFSSLFLLIFISFISLSSAENITTCRTLNQSGTYVLTQNINTTETCFIITGDNVNLNGNGYSITGNSSSITYFGVNATNRVNVTIANFSVINKFGLAGIYFYNVTNSTIINNSLFSDGTANNYQGGIDLVNSSDNVITGNNASYNSVFGITLEESSKRNNLTYNNINYNQYSGISLQTSSTSNNIYFNNISSNPASGIEFLDAAGSNFIFYNNIYNTTLGGGLYSASSGNLFVYNLINFTKYSVWIEGGIGNIFYNNNIGDGNINFLPNYDIYLSSSATLNYFVNTTYNVSKENVEASSQLYRLWYLNVNVTNSTGTVNNVNVSVYNSTGNLQFYKLTNSAGNIVPTPLYEYVNNGGTRSYSNNHTVNFSKSGYTTNSTSVNVTNNIFLNFNLLSSITSLIVNYNYSYNQNNQNGYGNGTTFLISDLTSMVINFFSLMPIIGIILAVVILIAVITLLVLYVRSFNMNNTESAKFQG